MYTIHGVLVFFFFFQAEDGIRDLTVTGVQTCALPIYDREAGGRDHGVQGLESAGADAPARDSHRSPRVAQRRTGSPAAGSPPRVRARPGAGRGAGRARLSRRREHQPRRRSDGVSPPPPPAGRAADDVAAGLTLPRAVTWAKFLRRS